jgi:hypothetical protein
MHIQRLLLIPPALLGVISVGLPWVAPAFSDVPEGMDLSGSAESIQWGFQYGGDHKLGLIILACFALALVMNFSGGLPHKASWLGRIMCFVLGIVCLVLTIPVLLLSSTIVKTFDFSYRIETELLWPAFGAWLAIASAITLILLSLFVGWVGRENPVAKTENSKPNSAEHTTEETP